jgi:hypothetical protein
MENLGYIGLGLSASAEKIYLAAPSMAMKWAEFPPAFGPGIFLGCSMVDTSLRRDWWVSSP